MGGRLPELKARVPVKSKAIPEGFTVDPLKNWDAFALEIDTKVEELTKLDGQKVKKLDRVAELKDHMTGITRVYASAVKRGAPIPEGMRPRDVVRATEGFYRTARQLNEDLGSNFMWITLSQSPKAGCMAARTFRCYWPPSTAKKTAQENRERAAA